MTTAPVPCMSSLKIRYLSRWAAGSAGVPAPKSSKCNSAPGNSDEATSRYLAMKAS